MEKPETWYEWVMYIVIAVPLGIAPLVIAAYRQLKEQYLRDRRRRRW
ncbi:hypothetical protein H8S95_16750 [Pontibacter sp. KCTC 32443]|nr:MULTISPECIES: hypothetical protein [Pontibacter]MBC5775729.1 hypothetical protein [Pontibacter sp. KCTC 32443]